MFSVIDIATKEQKSGSRRPHRKSRSGCTQCKKRHVKCDESRPQCGPCQRFDRSCDFSHDSGTDSKSITSPASSEASHNALASDAYQMRGSTALPDEEANPVCAEHLELMYHYTTYTADDLHFVNSQVAQLAKQEWVELALQTPHILYSMLAVSAFHLFSRNPDRKELYSRATSLQNVALRAAQPYITNLAQEHAIQIFIFSRFTSIYTFAELVLGPNGSVDPVSDTIRCLKLWNGTKIVVMPHYAYLLKTWLQPALRLPSGLDNLTGNPESVPQYEALHALACALPETEQIWMVSAIEKLFKYLSVLIEERFLGPETSLFYAWPVEINLVAMEVIERCEVLGLTLLAYYAALLAMIDEMWWMKGWPKVLLHGIESRWELADRTLLEWPRKIILKG